MKKILKILCLTIGIYVMQKSLTINAYADGGFDKAGDVVLYSSSQTFVAPEGGLYRFELYGGRGATAKYGSSAGGNGGYAYYFLVLEKGDTVTLTVGAAGNGSSGSEWTDYYMNHPQHTRKTSTGLEWEYTGYTGGTTSITYKGAVKASAYGGTGSWTARDDGGKAGSCCHPATANRAGSAGGYSSSGSVTFQDNTYPCGGGNGLNAKANGEIYVTLVAYSFVITATPSETDWTNEDSLTIQLDTIGGAAEGFSNDGVNYNNIDLYTITDNGSYTYYAKSEDGTVSSITVKVNNFDREKPSITDIIYINKLTTKKLTTKIEAEDK